MVKKWVLVIVVVLVGTWWYLRTITRNPAEITCKDCNVILITMTNLRYDHVSGNGYARKTTPTIDALMQHSVVFNNAFSHASWTLPEAMTIYTGLYPFAHGVMNRNEDNVLNPNTTTLVDVLKKSGYTTAIFSGGYDYDASYGLTSRFDVNDPCHASNGAFSGIRDAGGFGCTVPKAIDWLKANGSKKFFMHVQGFDAHCPFNQGEHFFDPNYRGNVDFSSCLWTFGKTDPVIKNGQEYYPVYSSKNANLDQVWLNQDDIAHLVATYDESISQADALVGQLLQTVDSLGLSKNTIIIFTSEHGDMFGKYGRFMRGGPIVGTLYDDVVHVPLVMRIPGLSTHTLDQLVEQVDMFPTITTLLGITQSSRSMLSANVGSEYVYAGSTFTPEEGNLLVKDTTTVSSIRGKEWKLIKNVNSQTGKTGYELFDLHSDPDELHNVASDNHDMLQKIIIPLTEWEKRN